MFCDKYVNDIEKAENIAQDSFYKILTSDFNVESESDFKSLLYTTAKNLCLSDLRHEKVKDKYTDFIKVESSDFYEENIEEQERNSLIYKAIKELPVQSGNIITLTVKGYSNKEIAEKLKISINTVKTLKRLSFNQLREKLSECKDIFMMFFIKIFKFF